MFFSTINRNAKSFLFAIVGAEYVLNLLPRGTHEYAKLHHALRSSPATAARAGLEHADLTGMTYNPLTKVYALGRDVDVNYLDGLPCLTPSSSTSTARSPTPRPTWRAR